MTMATDTPGPAGERAAPDAGDQHELKNVSYECFILALSILSVANILIAVFVREPEVQDVIYTIDWLLSCIFLGDFAYRLFTAPTKRHYFIGQRGWLDLLSSLPLPQAKVFRLFRVARVGRLLREVGPRRFFDSVLRDRAGSALLVILFLAVLLLEFGAMAVLAIEIHAPDGNIKDASDALWYTYVTVTTVGYGDRYPVTNPGRVVGVLIMTVGVGLFGTLTGFLANTFVRPAKASGDASGESHGSGGTSTAGRDAELMDELAEIRRELKALHERLGAPGAGDTPDGPARVSTS
jgi:voltage-gated potassium channel